MKPNRSYHWLIPYDVDKRVSASYPIYNDQFPSNGYYDEVIVCCPTINLFVPRFGPA